MIPRWFICKLTIWEALLYKNTRILPKLKSWPAGLAEEIGKAASCPSAPSLCRTCLGKPLSPIQPPLKGTMAQLPRFPEAPTALGHLLKTPAIPCAVLGLASSDSKSRWSSLYPKACMAHVPAKSLPGTRPCLLRLSPKASAIGEQQLVTDVPRVFLPTALLLTHFLNS